MLDRGATTEEIVDVVNIFYGEFVTKCIQDNHTHANQLDVNDGELNLRNATKVFPQRLVLSLSTLIFVLYRW